jgi:hypothetical protein
MAQAAIPVRGTSQVHFGWLGIGALVLGVALLAGFAGYFVRDRQTAATSPDQAMLNDLEAAWSTTYDAAKIAALYAPDAVMHDTVAGETSTGLAAIQAKASNYISNYGFKVVSTSAPIRQGNYIVNFVSFGTNSGGMSPGIGVLEVKDGKIVNHWVYAAE